ncbi:hypothetical protein, partial [Neobacillus vireti]|uniref:hypothetical protein n=1 Tax=Neobacillus vireti TaxID=220686 RepID=UPI002FFF4D7E
FGHSSSSGFTHMLFLIAARSLQPSCIYLNALSEFYSVTPAPKGTKKAKALALASKKHPINALHFLRRVS